VEDYNTPDYLNNLRKMVFEHISEVESAPGLQMHYLPSNLSPWANLPSAMEQEEEPFTY
jgi:hypothetical protein